MVGGKKNDTYLLGVAWLWMFGVGDVARVLFSLVLGPLYGPLCPVVPVP